MALVSVQRTSDLLASQSFGGHHGSYSSYGCCDEGVDPATLIALLTGKNAYFICTYFWLQNQIVSLSNCSRGFGNLFFEVTNRHFNERKKICKWRPNWSVWRTGSTYWFSVWYIRTQFSNQILDVPYTHENILQNVVTESDLIFWAL